MSELDLATSEVAEPRLKAIPEPVDGELAEYEENIRRYRAGEIDETKMQKIRLHFGTYAQRQEGVQMQRIKIPAGMLSAGQLARLADAAEQYGSGFIHFTTREDAQLYYVKLDEAPSLLRFLAEAGITTREACGNTVRNITACYRAGTSRTEVFNVAPYAEALFRHLVRNKYNQNLGRKFKFAFEGCSEDHSRLRVHDVGLQAVARTTAEKIERGFRVFLGGGLGASPYLARLYTDFLPEAELFNLAVSVLRLFDRYGERKSRMKARLKFLIESMGWNAFRAALEEERERVGPIEMPFNMLHSSELPSADLSLLQGLVKLSRSGSETPAFRAWRRDSIVEHKFAGYSGVHVRLKMGDLTSGRARDLAKLVERYSAGQLRVSIEQNLYLPWVKEEDLPALYSALEELGLAEPGAETVADITTCPGSDTCRLGIASAKGLGSALSEAFSGPLAEYRELAHSLKIKISGCPNGCAQHSIADIGFHAAAMSHNGRTVPAYLLFAGGKAGLDEAGFGHLIGKVPARRGVEALRTILALYEAEKQPSEDFPGFVARAGENRLKEILQPFREAASFEQDPEIYQDWGHENERFAVRQGIKGECAGSTVAETIPAFESASEWLAQAEAYFYHREFEQAMIAAFDAAARAARVPLYKRFVDPFTSEEALWEFENIFVLSGLTKSSWNDVSSRFEGLKQQAPSEVAARAIIDLAREFIEWCKGFTAEIETSPASTAIKVVDLYPL